MSNDFFELHQFPNFRVGQRRLKSRRSEAEYQQDRIFVERIPKLRQTKLCRKETRIVLSDTDPRLVPDSETCVANSFDHILAMAVSRKLGERKLNTSVCLVSYQRLAHAIKHHADLTQRFIRDNFRMMILGNDRYWNQLYDQLQDQREGLPLSLCAVGKLT